MKFEEIVKLVSDQQINENKLLELDSFLKARNIRFFFFNFEKYCIDRCKELIKQQGPSYVLSIESLQEVVLPKVDTKNDKIFDLLIEVLRDKLIDLSPSHSLILVDNYMFTQNIRDRQGYLDILGDILGPVAEDVKEIKFVTSPYNYDGSLYQAIKQLLRSLNPQIFIECNKTNDFHDRFWIVDEVKGLFVGTSVNGLGKRYALVDNLRDEDTKTIVGELKRLDLV